ncbi:hypothetical protein Hypma_014283 [Hypsizygus marmoreus]|uniref:Uncharacterized protein n=1 Tax=Hypsizygus marmoreus TaxID=39966 RepID=A0A369JAF4_HYPMA|nr:hypothetical protein Hypma_014283 [Hypsizygus marmoreus]
MQGTVAQESVHTCRVSGQAPSCHWEVCEFLEEAIGLGVFEGIGLGYRNEAPSGVECIEHGGHRVDRVAGSFKQGLIQVEDTDGDSLPGVNGGGWEKAMGYENFNNTLARACLNLDNLEVLGGSAGLKELFTWSGFQPLAGRPRDVGKEWFNQVRQHMGPSVEKGLGILVRHGSALGWQWRVFRVA